ncbi:MAG TPA: GNAT family N-acetyltransferase [Candidatus Alistipes faecavium]|nr:GNAT family N-acetyltransferase [Candidatus Alistipes faecavium]
MEIRPTNTPSHELLLLADESEASVADYVGRSRCFAAFEEGRIIGQYLLLHTRPFTAEVVNIAVRPDRQRRGIGTELLRHAIDTARAEGFRLLEIGTGDSGTGQIALYERCGFIRCGIDRDYFRKHYPAPIFENGAECRHMVRLRMELFEERPAE